jgi:hypothetical protein
VQPLLVTRLDKVATDNGFDLRQGAESKWLAFGSTKAPLKIWLTADDENSLTVGLSQPNVAHELAEYGKQSALVLPVDDAVLIDVWKRRRSFEPLAAPEN